MNWAFSDESERANLSLYGVLVLPVAEVAAARAEMRRLLLPGQRRVHMAKESPRRRHVVLDAIRDLPATTYVLRLRREMGVGRVDARQMLLRAACDQVVLREVTQWVLEAMEPRQMARDRQLIEHHLPREWATYDHRIAWSEPLLWAVDAAVWAAGTGGAELQRIRQRVVIVDIDPKNA